MRRNCPRTLDKPVLLFGLEPEDLGFLVLLVGIPSLLIGPIIPGALGIVGWFILVHFKKGKPTGYLLHRLYALGFNLPGLLPPVTKAGKYAIFTSHQNKKFAVR